MAVFATCERHGMMLGQCALCWDEERTRFEGRLAELTKERDEATQIADTCCKPAMEGLVKAEARIATLEAALQRYGSHQPSCPLHPMEPPFYRKLGCKCGFSTALGSA